MPHVMTIDLTAEEGAGTVGQLIRELQKFDANAQVRFLAEFASDDLSALSIYADPANALAVFVDLGETD